MPACSPREAEYAACKGHIGEVNDMSKRLTTLLAAGLIACAPLAARAADTLNVGVAAIYAPFAPMFAAEELGFYKERNLEVVLTVYRGGGAAQEAMAAGAADIITNSPMGAAQAISKGIKQKIVAAGGTITPEGWFVIVPKDSPIKSLADLQGKTMGVTAAGSTSDFFTLWVAKHAGVSIRAIPLGGPGMLPALKGKQVDALILWPNLSYSAVQSGAYRSVGDLGALMGPVIPDTVVASDALIASRPDVLKRYLQALTKAVGYMKDNEDWGKAFLKRYTSESSDAVIDESYRQVIQNIRIDGQVKPEWVQGSLELMTLVRGAAPVPALDSVFTDRFLPISQN